MPTTGVSPLLDFKKIMGDSRLHGMKDTFLRYRLPRHLAFSGYAHNFYFYSVRSAVTMLQWARVQVFQKGPPLPHSEFVCSVNK